MNVVRDIFNERKDEVNAYYNFVNNYQPTGADDSLFKILKSNLILMLYNLVESTISNAIEEIHNNIHSNTVSFNSLKVELKQLIIGNIKNVSPNKFVTNINDIAIDIIKHSFSKEKMFNGNIDGQKIREISSKYGFDSNTDYAKTKHGTCLVQIKGRRNDLAHGTFSFTEVGKEYSIEDLETIKDETINYLSEILDNIEYYLIEGEYVESIPV